MEKFLELMHQLGGTKQYISADELIEVGLSYSQLLSGSKEAERKSFVTRQGGSFGEDSTAWILNEEGVWYLKSLEE